MAIARLAYRQHGPVATWQLRRLGCGKDATARRVQAGRLHRIYRGVYAVGHTRLTLRGRWMAAVLACGPGAVLSHRAAAALHELRPLPSGPIDVSVPGRKRRGQKGIRVHNVRALHEDDRSTVDGIPVTSVARTLLDYAEVAGAQQLRRGVEEAIRRDLDGRRLDALIARSAGRHGLKALQNALDKIEGDAPWLQSRLEEELLTQVREAGIAEPQANVVVAGYTVDFYWPESRVVVEVDGYEFHKSRQRFEEDRHKDAQLQLAGCRVLRATDARIRSRAALRDVRQMLAAAA